MTTPPVPEIELETWRDRIIRQRYDQSETTKFWEKVSENTPDTKIDIPEEEPLLSEPVNAGGTSSFVSTSSLGSAAAGASAAGVATVLSSTTALYAPAVVIGAVGVGIAAKSVIESGQAHLPGHNYVGPGTDLSKGAPPVDRDDEIAKKHDEAYAKAESHSDISKADTEAVHEFHADVLQGNFHSIVGEVGILAKQASEHFAGPLYPVIHSPRITIPTSSNVPLVNWRTLPEVGKDNFRRHRHRQRKIRRKKSKRTNALVSCRSRKITK